MDGDPSFDVAFEALLGEVNEVKEECKNAKPENNPSTCGIDFLTRAAQGKVGMANDDVKKTTAEQAATKGKNALTFDLGTSDEQIVRLTTKIFLNPFDVLQMTPGAPDDYIKRRYRKLSLLVHPDKNHSNPKAADAFQVVSKAYGDIKNGETEVDLSKYADILDEAKRRVKREIREINALRKTKGDPSISNKDEDIIEDVIEMCEKMLCRMEERRNYARATLTENFAREEEEQKRLEEEEINQKELLKEFKSRRNTRGEYWQQFIKDSNSTKGVKRAAGFTKEELRDQDRLSHAPTQQASNLKSKRRKGAVGIDNSWKENWR